jgi:hypothetical protein
MVYSGVKTQFGVIETVFLIVGHVISENEKLKKKKKVVLELRPKVVY